MGLFDTVELYDDVHLPEYPEGITENRGESLAL